MGRASVADRMERCIEVFGGKSEGKGPLGRLRRRGEYSTMMVLQEVGERFGQD
jgi:hypothetical protein